MSIEQMPELPEPYAAAAFLQGIRTLVTSEEFGGPIAAFRAFCRSAKTLYLRDQMHAYARQYADLRVAAEREACAALCDAQHDRARTSSGAVRADACAAAIRARSGAQDEGTT